jgi:hypothetical protein
MNVLAWWGGGEVFLYEEGLINGRERKLLEITEGKETDISTAMFYIAFLYVTWRNISPCIKIGTCFNIIYSNLIRA